ncbi:unnamed protein product [Caenorhabditis angaria]|uniref:UPAR/Ly6 domain-containing protein n=1 Tax=Caenorhabditis angaria TaxID=860376 RepID=A0A9P1N1W3_9PELO|nr:unnamed protein product [Caenorhabditis angaria]
MLLLIFFLVLTTIPNSYQLQCYHGSKGIMNGEVVTSPLWIETCLPMEIYCEATRNPRDGTFLAGCASHNREQDVEKCPAQSNIWWTGSIYVECCSTSLCNTRLINLIEGPLGLF